MLTANLAVKLFLFEVKDCSCDDIGDLIANTFVYVFSVYFLCALDNYSTFLALQFKLVVED